jgi:hypothetical protein
MSARRAGISFHPVLCLSKYSKAQRRPRIVKAFDNPDDLSIVWGVIDDLEDRIAVGLSEHACYRPPQHLMPTPRDYVDGECLGGVAQGIGR